MSFGGPGPEHYRNIPSNELRLSVGVQTNLVNSHFNVFLSWYNWYLAPKLTYSQTGIIIWLMKDKTGKKSLPRLRKWLNCTKIFFALYYQMPIIASFIHHSPKKITFALSKLAKIFRMVIIRWIVERDNLVIRQSHSLVSWKYVIRSYNFWCKHYSQLNVHYCFCWGQDFTKTYNPYIDGNTVWFALSVCCRVVVA